jgi:hypothetical protein
MSDSLVRRGQPAKNFQRAPKLLRQPTAPRVGVHPFSPGKSIFLLPETSNPPRKAALLSLG